MKKKSVVDSTIEQIISALSVGEFKTGSKLPCEYTLMERFSVSRNSLRESLKILESMGVIEIKHGDGTYVCSEIKPSVFDSIVYSVMFDVSTSEELIELRQMLDEMMIKLTMKKVDDNGLKLLEANLAAFRICIDNNDIEGAAALDYEFHMLLVDFTQNPFFIRIAKGIYKLYVDTIGKSIILADRSACADVFHQKILNCIRNKDCASIESVVVDSLALWRENIRKISK